MRPIAFILIMIVPWLQVRAQHMQGISLSNYAGTNSLYHNPAFVADSRYSVFGNLVGVNYYVGNNHVKWDAPFSFMAFVTNSVGTEHRNESGSIKFPRTYLAQRLNGNTKYLNTGLDARLPALMISLKDGRFGIGFTSRFRTILNVSETTEPLARLIRGSTQDTTLHNISYTNQTAKLQLNGVAEYAVTLGGVLIDNDVDFLKVGITAKKLIGVLHSNIHIEQATYEMVPDPAWQNRRYQISAQDLDGTAGYTTDAGVRNTSLDPRWLLGRTSPGDGWGIDIGAVYEYRPDIAKYNRYNGNGPRKRDPSKNKYLYRLAASITDIGKLNFNSHLNRSLEGADATGLLNYDSFQNLSGLDDFFGSVQDRLQLAAAQPAAFKPLLPTALQLSADYQVKPNLYVSAQWIQTLRKPGTFAIRQESLLALTPRIEHRWYELSVPLSIMNHYRSVGIGLAGRAGPLWVGTDHIPGLFNIGKPKSLTLYAGLSMGIFRNAPDDSIPCWPPKRNWFQRLFRTGEVQ